MCGKCLPLSGGILLLQFILSHSIGLFRKFRTTNIRNLLLSQPLNLLNCNCDAIIFVISWRSVDFFLCNYLWITWVPTAWWNNFRDIFISNSIYMRSFSSVFEHVVIKMKLLIYGLVCDEDLPKNKIKIETVLLNSNKNWRSSLSGRVKNGLLNHNMTENTYIKR